MNILRKCRYGKHLFKDAADWEDHMLNRMLVCYSQKTENTAMRFLDAEAKHNKTSLLVLNTFLYVYPAFFFSVVFCIC